MNRMLARLGRDVREMACMLCAKKTIFIIEKNTTILQSMFVINKMTQWMVVGLRGNRVSGTRDSAPVFPLHFYIFILHFFSSLFGIPFFVSQVH